MEKEYSELIEFLGGKFDHIDEKFDHIDDKFDHIDMQLQELKETKAEKKDLENLIGSVDAYAKKADSYFQEMIMFSHKIDRHEKWLHLFAEKLGVKLEY